MSAKRHAEAVIFYGGVRPSFYGQNFTWPNDRAEIDSSGIEDKSTYILKGALSSKIGWNGSTASDYERDMFHLVVMDDNSKPYSVIFGSHPVEGDVAYFATGQVKSGSRPWEHNKLATFKADLFADTELCWGVMMHNTLYGAGLGVGTFFSPPQNLGAVPAGTKLVSNVHIPNPPGVTGTGVTVVATLQSAVAVGFSSPADHNVANFNLTTSDGDGAQVVVDGDATPTTDGWWRWKYVVAGTAGPLVFPAAVGGVQIKY